MPINPADPRDRSGLDIFPSPMIVGDTFKVADISEDRVLLRVSEKTWIAVPRKIYLAGVRAYSEASSPD